MPEAVGGVVTGDGAITDPRLLAQGGLGVVFIFHFLFFFCHLYNVCLHTMEEKGYYWRSSFIVLTTRIWLFLEKGRNTNESQ